MLARLDPDIRARIFGEDWALMWGTRNRIAHGYALVSVEIVRRTVVVDLPAIIGALQAASRSGS